VPASRRSVARLRRLERVRPLLRLAPLVRAGVLGALEVDALEALRDHNPLLFDFVLKRHLHAGEKRFPRSVFETRGFFDRQGPAARARLP